MVCGSSKLWVAAVAVVGVIFLSPAAALADTCQGGTSAVNIYSECIPTAGGGSHHNQGGSGKTGGTTTPVTPVYTNTTPAVVQPKIKVSKHVKKSLAHAGRDKKILTNLVKDPWLGATRAVEASSRFRATAPTTLGAVFDLGSGPTALFAMLAALAIALFGVGGLRRRQRKL